MTQTADDSRIDGARRSRDGSVLFVVVREERGSTDARFIGEFSGAASRPLPEVLRQVMRRGPSFLHFDLRDVTEVDEEGVKRLAHAVRICRRHGAMVKISTSSAVDTAIEAAGAGAALGILPRSLRADRSAVADGESPNGSRGPAPRY